MATQSKQLKKWLRISFFLLPIASVLSTLFAGLIKKRINKMLDGLDGYKGRVENVQLSIFAHRLVITDAYFNKIESLSGEKSMLINARRIEVSFGWLALLRGEAVLSLKVEVPEAKFLRTKASDGNEDIKKVAKPAKKKLIPPNVPIIIENFEITDGTLAYIDAVNDSTVDLKMANIEIIGKNLSGYLINRKQPLTEVFLRGTTHGGQLTANVKAWVLEKQPTFDVNMKIERIEMPQLNDFFNAYSNFDVRSGLISLYTEAAAKEGKFKGYAKPVITDLDIVSKQDMEDGIMKMLWEGVLAVTAKILESDTDNHQLATKIPFHGTFKNPNIGVWFAVVETLRNAFVAALKPSIDYTININSVKKRGNNS